MKQFVLSHGFSGLSELAAVILMLVYSIPASFHLLRLMFRWHDVGLVEFWKKWAVIACFLLEMFAFTIMPALFLSGSVIRGMIAISIGLAFSFLPVRITPRGLEEPAWLMKRIVTASWIISLVGFLVIPR